MKQQELWDIYVSKNPKWLTDGANLTPDGIKKLFDQTFKQAHKQGFDNGVATASKVSGKSSKDDAVKNAFVDEFGDIYK